MFKHFILCRYNLGLYTTNPYKILDQDKWMEERLPMFERLLGSLKAQTNQNFTLILGLDKNTNSDQRTGIVNLLFKYGIDFQMVFADPRTAIPTQHAGIDWLITTRMDNDDEYRPEFVEAIQSNFKEKTELLDVFGVQFDGKQFYTSGRPTPNSPFITLIESWHNPKTVLDRPHSIMNGEYPARWASKDALYIQHIHDSNAANKIIGKQIDNPWK